MGRIQSSVGLVTGVAIEDTVNQLMQLNGIPRDRLVSRNAGLQQEQVALTELTALVVGVQLSSDRLGQASLFSTTKVSSSKTEALTARSLGAPKAGSYSFIPVQQAQSQQLTSSLFASGDQKLNDGELVIHRGGFLDESVNLDALNAGAGVSRGKIRITDRSGVKQTIDLRFAQTANDVIDKINENDSLGVVASLNGDRFVLTDVSGGTSSNLKVEEIEGGTTAADLGLSGVSTTATTATGSNVYYLHENTALGSLRDGRGLDLSADNELLRFELSDGSTVSFSSETLSNSSSLGQLVSDINEAAEGKFEVRISDSGNALEVEDLTSGSGTFAISSPEGDLAAQLGFDSAPSGSTIGGARLVAGLGDVLLSSLGGGNGLGQLGTIQLTDRSGATDSVDLSSAETLQDVLTAINDASTGIQARLNRTKTGIEIIDTTGDSANDLSITNSDGTNTATALKIEVDGAVSSVDSGSLDRQYIGRNTTLKAFNGGKDFPLGSIRFTDSAGVESALNLNQKKPETVGDLLDAINSLDIGIEARLNATGDGILLEDTAGGEGSLVVTDVGSGKSAKTLGIAGTGGELTVGGTTLTGIDGSQTIRLTTTDETTIADLAEQINELDGNPFNASLLSLGSSGVRLLLNATASGTAGRVAIDSGIGVSFSETARARDALLAFGANESSGGVLVASSTNTFTDLVEDVEFKIAGTSTTPVTVSVTETSDTVTKQIETFVTQFNKLRDKLESVTDFDADSNSVGVLFGSNAALRIDLSYGRLFSSAIRGAGSISSLGQVGIRLNETGKLEFDKSKFDAALAADPDAVQEFFTNETSGFSAKAKAVADGLAGVKSGALLNRSNSLQTQIEQNTSRIESLNTRLDKQRTRLLTQFYNMEQAIAKLQTNLTALNQMQVIPPLYTSSS